MLSLVWFNSFGVCIWKYLVFNREKDAKFLFFTDKYFTKVNIWHIIQFQIIFCVNLLRQFFCTKYGTWPKELSIIFHKIYFIELFCIESHVFELIFIRIIFRFWNYNSNPKSKNIDFFNLWKKNLLFIILIYYISNINNFIYCILWNRCK